MKITENFIEYCIAGIVLLFAVGMVFVNFYLLIIFPPAQLPPYPLSILQDQVKHTFDIINEHKIILATSIIFLSYIFGSICVSYGFRERHSSCLGKKFDELFNVQSEGELTSILFKKRLITKSNKNDNVNIAKHLKLILIALFPFILVLLIYFLKKEIAYSLIYYPAIIVQSFFCLLILFIFFMNKDISPNKGQKIYNILALSKKGILIWNILKPYNIKPSYYDTRAFFLANANDEVLKQFNMRWFWTRLSGMLILPVLISYVSFCISTFLIIGLYAKSTTIKFGAPIYNLPEPNFVFVLLLISFILYSLFVLLLKIYNIRMKYMVDFLIDHVIYIKVN